MKTKKKAIVFKKGEVWTTDSRKGRLTVRLLEDVKIQRDGFFEVEIIEGVARYASKENNLLQKVDGMGTPGHQISMRTILTGWIKRHPELEVAA